MEVIKKPHEAIRDLRDQVIEAKKLLGMVTIDAMGGVPDSAWPDVVSAGMAQEPDETPWETWSRYTGGFLSE